MTLETDLRGASAATVRGAIERGDPLPGTAGFAGLADGALVRDVLGRELVYVDREPADGGASAGARAGANGSASVWSFDPGGLADPELLPAGSVRPLRGDPAGEDRGEPGGRQVWTLPDPAPETDEGAAVAAVRAAVRESVDEVGSTGLAVAFSGGVDSTAVAARVDAPLYVAGFEGSHDLTAARSAAAAIDGDLRETEVTHADIERAVEAVVAATGRTNAMDVGIAVPLYLVAERVAADGYDRLALGQGADELFGGYAKVARAPEDPRVEADTVRAARRETALGLPDQFERDLRAIRAAGVEPVAPLLHDRVVRAALALPGELLVAGEGRKVAFRRAVRAWVPESAAARDKKALQYGSLVARELDRLARQDGFKRRLNDHVRKYVEALTDA
jgi:asparagine synthase (glutamine-hydrolysing)